MDSTSAARPPVRGSSLCLFPGSSSSYDDDPDIVEIDPSSSWAGSSQMKRKRNQVVPHDVVEINEDDDQDAVIIIGESTSDYKNKKPVGFDTNWQKLTKDAPSKDPDSSTNLGLENDLLGTVQSSKSLDYNFPDEFGFEEEEEYYEEDYEDYEYDTDLIENDYNFSLASKFDDLDLPPGVEAPVPWLQKPVPEKPSTRKMKTVVEDEINVKLSSFKQFDTVNNHSDHHYSKPEQWKLFPSNKKPSKDWSKRIQNDWKVLEKDLPETIYVRVYEDRMDLLRAAVVGPAGTPYHDGLFFFDVYYPPGYPNEPPKVYYHSGGLRLNPNLYVNGKVCLSLLNTWTGSGCERWNPEKSTMLQVLVSIQALVLNAKPYFNEPGFAGSANTRHGEKKSLDYNEKTFLLSCKTMLYSLRRPPKHFEDLVAGHFRKHGRAILVACKAYMDGAQVGCVVEDGVQDVDEGDTSCSSDFKNSLKKLFEDLLMEFTVKGADCDAFLAQKVKQGTAKGADCDAFLAQKVKQGTSKGADCDAFLAQKVKQGTAKAVDTQLKL